MNRVTNRLDGLGQTKYTHGVLGNGKRTFREDGPWTADEITVTNRSEQQACLAIPRPAKQITRTVPAYVDVLGLANPTAKVTVNGNVASRKGEYFHYALGVANNSTAQYPTIAVVSQYRATQSDAGEFFVPASSESFGHDLDGNLTSDGRWAYTWDGENRLIEMKRDTSTPTLSSRQRLVFEYDAQGGRIRKQFYTHNGTTWVEQRDTICLYDGWNVIAELDANASNAKLRTYVWGSDLSGSLEGAGGVGGLLWVNNVQTTYDGQSLPTGVHFVAYDGNGNVLALVKASDGSVSARYEYGPFGEPVRQTGALADAQSFRFSTKWTDAESGLLYYGYRYYNQSTGRWLNRDPVAELDSINLYNFARNESIRSVDVLGLTTGKMEQEACKKYLNCQGGSPPNFTSDAWKMFFTLFYGDLEKNRSLPDRAIQAATDKISQDITTTLFREVRCNQSGSIVIPLDLPTFTIEKDAGSVNMGNWQLFARGTAHWNCSNAISKGRKCCCVCAADIHVKATLSKTYTFRAEGYNTDNASVGVQILNVGAAYEQFVFGALCGLPYYDPAGPAYFVSSEFEYSYSVTDDKCEGSR